MSPHRGALKLPVLRGWWGDCTVLLRTDQLAELAAHFPAPAHLIAGHQTPQVQGYNGTITAMNSPVGASSKKSGLPSPTISTNTSLE